MSDDPISVDYALARRILRGDEAAFRDLFDRFFPRLYRFALVRLAGDHDAAKDVVQQTFCQAIERLDSYRGEAALYTWFCQICRHKLIDDCRRRQRLRPPAELREDAPDIREILESIAAPPDAQPEVQAWQADILRLVQTVMDALPERYGDVLEWKYVDGLSVADIASRLNVGGKAAESLLTRARVAFRQAMLDLAEIPDGLRAQRQDWSL